MDMMGGMGLLMLVVLLVVAAVIALAIYLAIRAGSGSSPREPSARERLQHRLAGGEITPEEYYERDSALREAEPGGRRR